MCIAIYTPAGKVLPKNILENCFENNDDGCGFAYINTSLTEKRQIFVKKTLDFDTFYRQYQRATRVNPDSPFLIHFRIKTHGPVSKENCHPFMVRDDLVFIHNGIISGVGHDKEKSDTRLFNERVLKKLPVGWEDNTGIRTLVEDFIGHSKIITMDLDGVVQIFNEEKGTWKDNCWFSNTSYNKRTYYGGNAYGGYKSTTYGKGGATKKSGSNFSSGTKKIGTTQPFNTQRKRSDETTSASQASSKGLTYIATTSWTACDGCGKWKQVSDMHPYEIYEGLYEIYCVDCERKHLVDGIIREDEVITVDEFVKGTNELVSKGLEERTPDFIQ